MIRRNDLLVNGDICGRFFNALDQFALLHNIVGHQSSLPGQPLHAQPIDEQLNPTVGG